MPSAPQRLRAVRVSPEVGSAELVARALAGDASARELIFRMHAPAVTAVVDRLLRNRADAEDVVQITFETAFDRMEQLRDPNALPAWLLQIAVRRCQMLFRRRKLARLLGLERPDEGETLLDHAASDLTPEERTEIALLDVALSRMPPASRIAWTLHHVEGLTLPECARACGCSLATIKRRIHTASELVRSHVGGSHDH